VIRSNNITGDQLEDAVRTLMGEATLKLPADLIEAGSKWKYLDDGSDQGTAWKDPGFDDSSWRTGTAVFGFGRGDEATRLKSSGAVTWYFRREFEVADPASVRDVLLHAWYDDGIAVYVNGTQVARRCLSEDAGYDRTAARHVTGNGINAVNIGLDPAVLKAGRNVIAVEVHQAERDSVDLRFDASLSSNVLPMLKEKLADPASPECAYAMVVASGLRARGGEVVPQLKKLIGAGDFSQQLRAMVALADVDPQAVSDVAFSEPTGVPAAQERIITGRYLRDGFWRVVRQSGFSRDDYSLVARRMPVVKQLSPAIKQQSVIKALAEYRMGEYERALVSLRGGALLRFRYDPFELACMGMCQKQLGQHEAASNTIERAKKMLEQPEWAYNVEARELVREAERKIAEGTAVPKTSSTTPPPAMPRKAG
jgi:hypothetical protein